jgi:hypothetical protein
MSENLKPIEAFPKGFNPFSEKTRNVLNDIARAAMGFNEMESGIIKMLAKPDPVQRPYVVHRGKITAVLGSGVGGEVTYNAVSTFGDGLKVEGKKPILRPLGTIDIFPAEVGDPCLMFYDDVEKKVEIVAWTEIALQSNCEEPPTPQSPSFGASQPSAMEEAGYTRAQEADYAITK